jgi:hypothetical protein
MLMFHGCYVLNIDAAPCSLCADHLNQNWVAPGKGTLALGGIAVAAGFDTYGKTLLKLNPVQQKRHTLVFTARLLPLARQHVPGFADIESCVIRALASQRGSSGPSRLRLHYVHALNQSCKSGRSASFGWHRDDEVVDIPDDISSDTPPRLISITVLVKLTCDESAASPSQMLIGGASAPFTYGAAAGSACWFRSRLYHTSLPDASPKPKLKLAFFFSEDPEPGTLPKPQQKRLRRGL